MADSIPLFLAAFEAVSADAWRQEVERGLEGADFDRRLVTHTPEGIAVRPLYTAADTPALAAGIELPGLAPYLRGREPLGRWDDRRDARVAIDHPDPEVAQSELAHDLRHGAGSVWLRLDASARLGRDEAVASRADEHAAPGIAWLSAAQVGALLDHLDAERVPVALDAGGNALPAVAILVAALRARGVRGARLAGTFGADPLGALAADGALPCSLAVARGQLAALSHWGVAQAPAVRVVTVSTLPYHDAGAHAAQELAYALATATTYLRWLVEAGLPVDAAARQIAFRVAVGNDVFMEIAKLRALRWLWAEVVRTAGGSEAAQAAPVHGVTSARTRTRRDPWVNMLRETAEAFTAVVGGADAVTTSGFDAALGVSDAFGRRIALNTQLVLDEEAHVGRVADPAGGSYYAESLTDALARSAWERFRGIEADAGMSAALFSGRVADELATTASERRDAHARRARTITGVSDFAELGEEAIPRRAPDAPALARARRDWLDRANRNAATREAFAKVTDAALVDAAIEAAVAGASLGALTAALAGDDAAASLEPLPIRRDAAEFERLRDAADRYAERTGARARVFLANLGPLAAHKPRSDFATGLFAVGGIGVHASDGFEHPAAAAEAFATSGASVACICATDAAYAEHVEPLARLLRERGASEVIVAGRPSEREAAWRSAGVGAFVHRGSDVVRALEKLHAALGVGP